MTRSLLAVALTTLLACSSSSAEEEGRASAQSSVRGPEVWHRCVEANSDELIRTEAALWWQHPQLQRSDANFDVEWVVLEVCRFCGTDAQTDAGLCGEESVY